MNVARIHHTNFQINFLKFRAQNLKLRGTQG